MVPERKRHYSAIQVEQQMFHLVPASVILPGGWRRLNTTFRKRYEIQWSKGEAPKTRPARKSREYFRSGEDDHDRGSPREINVSLSCGPKSSLVSGSKDDRALFFPLSLSLHFRRRRFVYEGSATSFSPPAIDRGCALLEDRPLFQETWLTKILKNTSIQSSFFEDEISEPLPKTTNRILINFFNEFIICSHDFCLIVFELNMSTVKSALKISLFVRDS